MKSSNSLSSSQVNKLIDAANDGRIRNLEPEQKARIRDRLLAEVRLRDLRDAASGLTVDLQTFFRAAWKIIEPETPLCWSWHYEYLAEWLTLVADGGFKRQYPTKLGLIINVPPRSAKSSLVRVCFPVWTWLTHPERRFLCASYSGSLSEDHNRRARDLVRSLFFQERFGNRFQISSDRDRVSDFGNDRTGYVIATSIEGSGTGFGADICIGDDLISADGARSKAVRSSTNAWLDDTFRRRLNDYRTGVFVHISQRLAEDDPTGHLLGEDDEANKLKALEWVHIKIQREAQEDETYRFPVSGKVYKRAKGDILQADRVPPHVLSSLKVHSREWSGQEQQEPSPATGIVFDPNWWRYYRRGDPLPLFDLVVLSVDCAFKGRIDNDYVAIHKWGITGARRTWLNRRTEHLGYVGTKTAIKEELRAQDVEWASTSLPRATVLLIEDKANGPAIVDELSADPEIAGAVSIVAVNPEGGKDSRAYAMSTDAEAGNIYLPEDAPWIGPVKLMFKAWNGEGSIPHDDDIDAASQLVNWSRNRFGWVLQGAAKFASQKTEIPTDPSAIAVELGTAQKVAATKADISVPSVFGEEKKPVGKVLTTHLLKRDNGGPVNGHKNGCPACGNLALNITGDYKKCVKCGWDSKQKLDGDGHPLPAYTDLKVVEFQGNPAALDQTLQGLGPAVLLQKGPGVYLKQDGYYTIRVFGDPGFIKFACEQQGYCKVL
jgi:predicted phage terminase large subunit-like protein